MCVQITAWRSVAGRMENIYSMSLIRELATECAKDIAKKERRLTEVGCRLLGRPRPDHWYEEDGVGKFVAFSVDDHRMVGVLCAPLLDNRWFVHFGSRTDGELDATNPFREDHLQVKDLIDDAWNMKSRHIRLRTDENVNAMRGLVQSKDDHWLRLVAIAHFRAEALKDPAMNLARAGRGFESNPFHWHVLEDRRSQVMVTFLWSWRNALEDTLFGFTEE